ncbi:unnamed protein product, partial [Prorocentrum cordatum]
MPVHGQLNGATAPSGCVVIDEPSAERFSVVICSHQQLPSLEMHALLQRCASADLEAQFGAGSAGRPLSSCTAVRDARAELRARVRGARHGTASARPRHRGRGSGLSSGAPTREHGPGRWESQGAAGPGGSRTCLASSCVQRSAPLRRRVGGHAKERPACLQVTMGAMGFDGFVGRAFAR